MYFKKKYVKKCQYYFWFIFYYLNKKYIGTYGKSLNNLLFFRSVIFGRLGVEIAKAIVTSILPYESAWSGDLKLLTQFHIAVKESVQDVQYSIDCISDFISKRNLSREVSNLTSLNVIETISSLQIAEEVSLNIYVPMDINNFILFLN